MLGLGETEEELLEALGDLRAAGCNLLTLGQYLQPTKHLPVVEFIRRINLPSTKNGRAWAYMLASGFARP